MFCLKLYGEAVEFAHIAADISKSLGKQTSTHQSRFHLLSFMKCVSTGPKCILFTFQNYCYYN